MIHNYFTLNEKQFKIKRFFLENKNQRIIDLSIKKKISKLNEYQHLSLLCDLFMSKPLIQITKEELEYFTLTFKKTEGEADDYWPRSNFATSDPTKDYYVVFNHKIKLYFLVDYYLTTTEYPKQTLICKLLFIKEKILTNLINTLTFIKLNFQRYYYDEKNYNNDNYVLIEDLLDELDQNEKNYLDYISAIDAKINSFSDSKKLNYLINTNNETLLELYNRLEKNDFIDIHKTSSEQFINVLKLDWHEHESIIHFQMDHIQFNFFINHLNNFLKIKITLSLIEKAENIYNKNGSIKANSVYTSVSKSKMLPKDAELIKSIFDNL